MTLIVSIEPGASFLKICEGGGAAWGAAEGEGPADSGAGEGEGSNEFCDKKRKFGQRQTENLKQHDEIVKMRRKVQDNFILSSIFFFFKCMIEDYNYITNKCSKMEYGLFEP